MPAPQRKSFTKAVNDPISKIRENILRLAAEEAIKESLISKRVMDLYMSVVAPEGRVIDIDNLPVQKQRKLFEKIRKLLDAGKVSEGEMAELVNWLGAQKIVLHALDNLDFDIKMPNPYQLARSKIKDGIGLGNKKTGAEDALKFLSRTEKNIEKMVQRIVFTMHPNIFDTEFGIEQTRGLTNILVAGYDPKMNDMKPVSYRTAQDQMAHMMRAVKKGETLTPHTKVTTVYEAGVEKGHVKVIRQDVGNALLATLEAFADMALEAKDKKIQEQLMKMAIGKVVPLNIFKKDRKNLIEARAKKTEEEIYKYCTWGRAGDSDGRPGAGDISYSKHVLDEVKTVNGEQRFTGETRDLRNNAKLHSILISALGQGAYRTDAVFRNVCEEFITQDDPHNKGQKRHKKYGLKPLQVRQDSDEKYSAGLILSALKPDDMDDFITLLMERNISLIPKGMKEDVEVFNEEYYKIYKGFVTKNGRPKLFQERGFSPEPSFEELAAIDDPDDRGRTLADALREDVRKYSFPNGVQYELEENGLNHQPQKPGERTDYLRKTKMIGDNGEIVDISVNETTINRKTLMEAMKKLIMVNKMIDSYPKDTVSDRHQIANFSNKNDFLILMKLFQDAGLVEVKDDKVQKVKVQIMPLFETVQDMRNAPEIMKELLKNDLVKSYYKKVGMAQFMVGFSDGAKSAGIFPSEWEIYKCMQNLQQLFTDEMGQDFKVTGFYGRGKGTARGGLLEHGLHQQLVPLSADPRGDDTWQSNLPSEMGINHHAAQYHISSRFWGTLDGAARAETITAKEREKLADIEKDIDCLSSRATEVFDKLVRQNEQVMDNIKGAPSKAPNISSRPAARGGGKDSKEPVLLAAFMSKALKTVASTSGEKDVVAKFISEVHEKRVKEYDEHRAVPTEHASEMMHLVFHAVGFKKAAKEFIGQNGRKAAAAKFAEMMEHPFFATMMHKMKHAVKNYKSFVAEMYGEKSGTMEFVKTIKAELNGLDEMLGQIISKDFAKKQEKAVELKPGKAWQTASNFFAHAIYGKSKKEETKELSTLVLSDVLRQLTHDIPEELSKRVWGRDPKEIKTREPEVSLAGAGIV